jgi:hypothetical protein
VRRTTRTATRGRKWYLVDVAEDELAVVDDEEGREEWIQQRATLSRENS